jgi:DNA-binding MarR family transcriptional regulator
MEKPELLPIAESLAGLIPRLARGMSSPEKDGTHELSLAQLRLCGVLSDGPSAMSALSRELGVSLSALTQIADRLERAGIVKRVAAGDDRRVRCLQLTARGENMMRKRREARLRRSMDMLERLTAAEREQVRAAVETLVAHLPENESHRRAVAANGSNGHGNTANGHGRAANGHNKARSPRFAMNKKTKARTTS